MNKNTVGFTGFTLILLFILLELNSARNAGSDDYFMGIDVGTGSARAGIFGSSGKMISHSSFPIKMFRPTGEPDFYQQSSEDIWNAVCCAVQMAMKNAGLDAKQIKGIGFDATCSLVILGENNEPISVSPGDDSQQEFCENIIVWLDHRAIAQADFINKSGHKALRCVGGTISPEHEIPKILWLKSNRPDVYQSCHKMLDLGDFLAFKATGKDVRSLCTTGCKWALDCLSNPGNPSWDLSFFSCLGLEDIDTKRIGEEIRNIGAPIDGGLNKEAAGQLGLHAGTPVGVGMIDAHAGGMGCLGATLNKVGKSQQTESDTVSAVEGSITLIAGTSTCHMISSSKVLFVENVWGPFWSAVVPGFWLQEGGQSVTGALLDHLIQSHPAYTEAKNQAESSNLRIYDVLTNVLKDLAAKQALEIEEMAFLTKDFHITPDFCGNRGPVADPELKGAITGLSLACDVENLALVYLAGIQAVVYGTRHIMEQAVAFGHPGFSTVYVCGGLSKQPLFLKEQADALGLELILPRETEAVLLGSAMAGAAASGLFDSVHDAMSAMGAVGGCVTPNLKMKQFHDKKYKVFKAMIQDQIKYRAIMAE